MAARADYVGQRLSLKKQPCTVRYVGSVADKPGEWLGVEWDDPSRGKHDGTHAGTTYFRCRSESPTAASFLRPRQTWDESRTFLQALKEKYISPEDATNAEVVYISGKHAEKVGLEKFAKRQAQLQGIHTLVLDRMCIRHQALDDETSSAIAETCANITSLDLGGNLFETWREVVSLYRHLPKLSSLTLDSNRLHVSVENDALRGLPGIRYLSLADTLFSPIQVSMIAQASASLCELVLGNNRLRQWGAEDLPDSLRSLDLSNNDYATLADLGDLWKLSNLHTVTLKGNRIFGAHEEQEPSTAILSSALVDLDLRNNAVSSWSFFHALNLAFPSLRHLRVANNPLYTSLTSADGKPLSTEDGYMLTIARMPKLETLNYSKITGKERLNAETYYLGQITAELSKVGEAERAAVIAGHPRWQSLCEEYGEPTIASQATKGDQIDPNSLAARLVEVRFRLDSSILDKVPPSDLSSSWTQELPRSLDIYGLLGQVGKRLRILPLKLKLVWETGERDPLRTEGSEKPEMWDSSEEDEDDGEGDWIIREMELVAGTRAIGTYLEGRTATVRIEMA